MQNHLYKYILIFIFLQVTIIANAFSFSSSISLKSAGFYYDTTKLTKAEILFDSLRLGRLGLGRRAYDYAMLGYNILKAKRKLTNDNILSIADMSLPSGKKRLFIIDVKNYKLLFVTYVAHGKNTGLDKAFYFSNEPESNKSSVGFYTTLGTYTGTHGYSLRLQGQEIGFNNKALERDIVVHSADYVNESVVKSQGYVGRSLGCPAVSSQLFRPIIDKIKDGTCLFVYGNDGSYINNSKLLKQPIKLNKENRK